MVYHPSNRAGGQKTLINPELSDTIAAIATPAGQGGVGIIRASGPEAAIKNIAKEILGFLPPARNACYTPFLDTDNTSLDEGIALFFPAPHSFTGEDVLELQGHGGPVVMDLLLQRCIDLGARIAQPGEFSERAFLNDKLDLAQAEAIADLIESGSEKAARSALRSLQGEFSTAVNQTLKSLIKLRTYVEAALDFPEEEIDFLQEDVVKEGLQEIKQALESIQQRAKQGSLLREGMHLVIAGQPNAGKSSLLNCLAGREAAIVTAIPGTTRDVLREQINIDGLPLYIVDTAGLRESTDPIEKEGVRRAWAEINNADLLLLIIDQQQGFDEADQQILNKLPQQIPLLKIYNKIDLSSQIEGRDEEGIFLSAQTGEGIDLLVDALEESVGYNASTEGTFTARRRHLKALEETSEAVTRAEQQLQNYQAGELMAAELLMAQQSLGKITGQYTSDDLLGEIFSSFCIGK
jgi:tRNA modification GTPase